MTQTKVAHDTAELRAFRADLARQAETQARLISDWNTDRSLPADLVVRLAAHAAEYAHRQVRKAKAEGGAS